MGKIKDVLYSIWTLTIGVLWFMAVVALIAFAYALCGGLDISMLMKGGK